MQADLEDFANLFASLDNYENEPMTYMHAIILVRRGRQRAYI